MVSKVFAAVLLLVDDVAGFLVFGLLSLLWLQLKRAGVLQPTRIGSYHFIHFILKICSKYVRFTKDVCRE